MYWFPFALLDKVAAMCLNNLFCLSAAPLEENSSWASVCCCFLHLSLIKTLVFVFEVSICMTFVSDLQ